MSKPKVNSKKMAIIILTISAYLVLAAHLPMSAFSQLPFLPDSHTSTNSNLRTTQSNNKISSSETANSSSLNKITNTSKLKLPTLQIKGIEVTATNLSYKGVDKFGIKEIYPTKKGGGREWYINMADPRNDPTIFSTGFNQSLIKQNSTSSNDGHANNNGSSSSSGTTSGGTSGTVSKQLKSLISCLTSTSKTTGTLPTSSQFKTCEAQSSVGTLGSTVGGGQTGGGLVPSTSSVAGPSFLGSAGKAKTGGSSSTSP